MNCPSCSKEIPDSSVFCNLCGKTTQVKPKSTAAFSGARLLLILLLVFLGWYLFRVNYGSRQTNQAIAAAVRAPITLKDEVQNLPASSWKGVALNLPYDGSIDVDLRIVQGNPVDVFLTDADQLDAMNRADWKQVRAYTEFNAVKTKTYRRTGQLRQGSYYLVIRDTSLGILSQSASDVAVKVALNP
jgi:hypothetical protein